MHELICALITGTVQRGGPILKNLIELARRPLTFSHQTVIGITEVIFWKSGNYI